jgi:hypothetical protein
LRLRKDAAEVRFGSGLLQRWCDGAPGGIDPSNVPLLVLQQVLFDETINDLRLLGLLVVQID